VRLILIDLHLHTTASDGKFSPREIVHLAAIENINIIAITDHDTMEGIPEATQEAQSYPFLKVIPGVEISTDSPGVEVHLLGYFASPDHSELEQRLAHFRSSRRQRAHRMVQKLGSMGIHLDYDRVKEIAGPGSVGRPHIAQAMMEKGYIESPKEAFEGYIGRDSPAYVEREKITPKEAVELIVRSSGIPVLAHPRDIPHLAELISELKEVGLEGMEVYYNGYVGSDRQRLKSLAQRERMVPFGGSDYHGIHPDETSPGRIDFPQKEEERIISFLRERQVLP
jgi:hypothetical protein